MTTVSRWVRIAEDGAVEVRVGKVELGQGILTALGQLAADELDVSMARLRMLPAHTALGPDEGLTAGSMSVATSGPAVRLACANARALLLAEAARRWSVDPGGLSVEDGCVRTADGSRRASYADLASGVDLDVEVRTDVPLRDTPSLAGTSVARLDLPDKVTGRPRFIADLRLPGMMHGRVVRPPALGARLLSTVEVPGTVRDGSFLGVVGEDEAAVTRAADRLRAASTWSESDVDLPDDPVAFVRAGPHETVPVLDEDVSGIAGRRVSARYSRPYLAHASIAPSSGIACWEADGRLSVWSHSQGIVRLRDAIAQALDLDPGRISVQHVENAGSYGHNGADDAAFDAVLLARSVPTRPVLVTWSRHDELTWSPFGSAMAAEVSATVGAGGRIQAWTYDVWSQGHIARPGYAGTPGLLACRHLDPSRPVPAATDPPMPAGGSMRNSVPGYEVGARRITGHRLLDSPVRTSSLRSLGAFMNVFAIESFMDELAAACGRDPLEYRLAHLTDPRARRVLTTAATAAGWGGATAENTGRGIGFARYKGNGAYCAVVAEVEAAHEIRVRTLTVAVDVGRVVNPCGVRNQIEGGATQAASWTLRERVRFDGGRVISADWESYPILRFGEVPEIHVELAGSDEPSVGAGEAAQGPTAGAIANAVADAIGVRVRDLPLTTQAVVAAIQSQ